MKHPKYLLRDLEELSAKYRRKSCEPLWLGGQAGRFLIEHWDEVKAIMENDDG